MLKEPFIFIWNPISNRGAPISKLKGKVLKELETLLQDQLAMCETMHSFAFD